MESLKTIFLLLMGAFSFPTLIHGAYLATLNVWEGLLYVGVGLLLLYGATRLMEDM